MQNSDKSISEIAYGVGYKDIDYPWTGGYNDETAVEYPRWYEDRTPDTDVWTDSYMQVSFGINDAEIYSL